MAEHVIALIFALRRSLVDYNADVRRGDWRRASQFCLFAHPVREIAGATIGIVGWGALGRAVADRALALGMRVLATSRRPFAGSVDLDAPLRDSDVVSLHCLLTPATRGMIGARELALMKPDAILINTARDALVDEAALAGALSAGLIGGAGIDVLSEEPPRNGNLLLDVPLPNLIVTPHIAWTSRSAMERLAEQLIQNIEAFVAGNPRNVLV